MDGSELLQAIWNATNTYTTQGRTFRSSLLKEMEDILTNEGRIVCEDEGDLRSKALEKTDLVEPGDE